MRPDLIASIVLVIAYVTIMTMAVRARVRPQLRDDPRSDFSDSDERLANIINHDEGIRCD